MAGSSADRCRLSVALIVRNAARELKETLESVAEIADEIVVLDTGSTDDTPRVARENATRVQNRIWDDSFSNARNAAMKMVTGDWVFWLDAGETISFVNAQALRKFVDEQADITKAYALLVQTPAASKQVAGEQVARVRLMPNLPGIRFEGRVRESLNESLKQLGLTVTGLPFQIQRGMREHDTDLKARRARRNIQLADLDIKQFGPRPYLLNCLGESLQALGENQRATIFFRQSLAAAERGSTEMLEAFYGLVTSFDNDPNSRQVQIAICLQALEVFPLDCQLLCAMGGYLQAQGRLDLASRSYETAYRYGQINPETWHVGEVRELAASCFSLSLQLQNRADEAKQILEEAVATNKQAIRLHRQLIDLCVRAGEKEEALKRSREFPPGTPLMEAFRSAIRGACLARDKNWIAAKAYLETAFNSGSREPLCLRWLTMTLISLNELSAARQIVEHWKVAEPNSADMNSYWTMLQEHAEAMPDLLPATPSTAPTSDRTLRVDPISPATAPTSLGTKVSAGK